jgi:tRNA(Ile)-lysidine synthase
VVGRLGLGTGASETRARVARHAWLERTRRAEGADAIAFAHHLDDQAETVLLRVLAGSGPAGLAGMVPRRGTRLRPLLTFRRAELLAYLECHGLTAWADPANADPAHRRSWLRTEVLPRLAGAVPDVVDRLVRLGEQAARNRRAWDAALAALPGLDVRPGTDRISVAGLPLAGYDSDLAVAVLQAVARQADCVLGTRRADRVLRLLKAGRSGSVVELGAGWRVELAFGRLSFYRSLSAPIPLVIGPGPGEARWGPWLVRWRRGAAPSPGRRDGWEAWFIADGAAIRSPKPGDRVDPLGGAGRRLVARCLQEARIERSRRAAWPVVEVDGGIEWVAGVCRGRGAVPGAGQDALQIEVSDG